LYLEQKGTTIEGEETKSLETLFTKSVPAGVREFIALCSGNGTESSARRGKQKRRKPEKPATDNPVTKGIRSKI